MSAAELKPTKEQEALAVREPDQVVIHDKPVALNAIEKYRGISQEAVSREQAGILMESVADEDIEIRPDGMIYLPEIKYRRRLNCAFLPGGWALMPTSPFQMRDNTIMRQYALYVGGRFIAETVGEQEYIEKNPNMTYATAAEGCKSNALMRCCKDLGIASELWDPGFIAAWTAKHAVKVWNPKSNKFNYRRKDREPFFWEKKQEKQEQHGPAVAPETATPEELYGPAPEDQSPQPPAVISDAQRKRLFAITQKAMYSNELVKKMLTACGYSSSTDILKKHYQTICEYVEGTPVEQALAQMDALAKWCKEN